MKIAQIVAPGASEYERKSQRVDFAALSEAGHQVAVYQSADVAADVAHVYGKVRKLKTPHIVEGKLTLPEAVEEAYWATNEPRRTTNLIGTFARQAIHNLIEQTYLRLTRTRDDIEWRLFERPPTPSEPAEVGP